MIYVLFALLASVIGSAFVLRHIHAAPLMDQEEQPAQLRPRRGPIATPTRPPAAIFGQNGRSPDEEGPA